VSLSPDCSWRIHSGHPPLPPPLGRVGWDPPEIGFRGGGKVRLSDEDVDVSDWNNGKSSRVFSSRHPEVIRWDDGEAGIVEDTPDGDGIADACEGGSRLDLHS
jgi:hypothetical protein